MITIGFIPPNCGGTDTHPARRDSLRQRKLIAGSVKRRRESAPPPREEHFIASLDGPTPGGPAGGPISRVHGRRSARAGTAECWLLAGLLLWLLVGPRIQLPLIPALRVEDVVFAALALLCLRHLAVRDRPRGVSVAVLGVAATGLVSAAIAGARGTLDPVTAALFAVRPLEYWIAFPAALLLLRLADGAWTRRIDVILGLTTVLQTTFAVLQYYFHLPVGFSHAAYTRAAGLTVGPYELGAISAALLVYWVSRGSWVLASLSAVALAASVSRISIVGAVAATAVLAVFWTVRQRRRILRVGWRTAFVPYVRSRPQILLQVLAVAAAGLVLAFTFGLLQPSVLNGPASEPTTRAAPTNQGPATASPGPTTAPSKSAAPESTTPAPQPRPGPDESVTGRLADTSVLGSWNVAAGIAAAVPPVRTAAEYQDIAYGHLTDYVNTGSVAGSGADPSNLVRFFRWHLILDTINEPIEVVFGLGPSFAGPSVDGSYLRFFADGGVLGVIAWLALIVLWLRRSPLWMVCVTVSLLVGALFIDILYAERPMVLYWTLLALAITRGASSTSTQPHDGSEMDATAS